MTSLKSSPLPVLALTVLIGTGVTHGYWTGRWSSHGDFDGLAARFAKVPMSVGPWSGRDQPLDERTRDLAGISDYLMRRYDKPGGESVTALLVCGRPGPIAAHTPEVCYSGAGFAPSSPRVKVTVDTRSPPDVFWAADLAGSDGLPLVRHLRIYYAWGKGGEWAADESPRIGFAGTPVLYKLYVVRDRSKSGPGPHDDPAVGFLKEFLPALRATLFAKP